MLSLVFIMVIIRPALCISGCAQGSSELSYRQVAARDYRVPEGIDRHSVNNYVFKRSRITVYYCIVHKYIKCPSFVGGKDNDGLQDNLQVLPGGLVITQQQIFLRKF